MDASSIAQFKDLTGTSDAVAKQFLAGSDLQTAVASYYAAQEAAGAGMGAGTGGAAGDDEDPYAPTDEEKMNRGLMGDGFGSGAGAGGSGSGSGSGARAGGAGSSTSRFATLGSVRADEEDEEDLTPEERRRAQELYAGGGRSGLAIQNPDDPAGGGSGDLISNILKKAAEGSAARGEAGAGALPATTAKQPPKSTAFTGSGMTLGSDEAPSVAVPSPGSRAAEPTAASIAANRRAGLMGMLGNLAGFGGTRGLGGSTAGSDSELDDGEDDLDPVDTTPQIRELTFWRNGFSIGDGPLVPASDPRHDAVLRAILAGTAPVDLLGLRVGQPVEVRVAKRLDEDYVEKPREKKAFEGAGNRLGSPAPEVASSSAASSSAPTFSIDASQPTTSVQVRLADGTKLTARLNLSHTVGDIRGFIRASQPTDRAFLIQTTFPNRVLEDDAQTVEQAGLKNAVVVQRWA